jgi:hypothetical protein
LLVAEGMEQVVLVATGFGVKSVDFNRLPAASLSPATAPTAATSLEEAEREAR